MTSRYYTEGFTGTKGALARSGQIETEYQSIDTALKSVEVEMDDAVRFTASDFTPPNFTENATNRASTVVGFNASGSPILVPYSTVAALVEGRKNLCDNANFDLWQRGTTFTAFANGYFADRWRFRDNASGVVDISRSTVVPDNGSLYSAKLDVATADATLSTSDIYSIQQRIEGHNIRSLFWGAAGAKKATLSFWVRSSKTGIFTVAIRNSGSDRSYVAEVTISAADTWEKKTVTLTAGPVDGTWLLDSSIGLTVDFVLAVGTDAQTTKDVWQTGNYHSTSAAANFLDSTANDFYVSQVQMEVADNATEFEHLSIAHNVAICERYYEKSYNVGTDPGSVDAIGSISMRTSASSSTHHEFSLSGFKVKKRVTPTMTWYSTAASTLARLRNLTDSIDEIVTSTNNEGEFGTGSPTTAAIGVNKRLQAHWTADSELYPMNIQTVRWTDASQIHVIVNEGLADQFDVSMVPGNRHWDTVQAWIDAGNTPDGQPLAERQAQRVAKIKALTSAAINVVVDNYAQKNALRIYANLTTRKGLDSTNAMVKELEDLGDWIDAVLTEGRGKVGEAAISGDPGRVFPSFPVAPILTVQL